MPEITNTPAPFPSSIFTLNKTERFNIPMSQNVPGLTENAKVNVITAMPEGFSLAAYGRSFRILTTPVFPPTKVPDLLPPHLRTLVLQAITHLNATGPRSV